MVNAQCNVWQQHLKEVQLRYCSELHVQWSPLISAPAGGDKVISVDVAPMNQNQVCVQTVDSVPEISEADAIEVNKSQLCSLCLT